MTVAPTITVLTATDLGRHLPALGGLLHACVHAGASIGFVLPFSQAEGEGFWRDTVLPAVRTGTRTPLVARDGDRIAGSIGGAGWREP